MFTGPTPRDAQALVQDQVRLWQEQKRKQPIAVPEQVRPLIAVSREFGSLGATVGKRSAEQLGFAFWNQEIVHAVAQQSGATTALLMSLDERARGWIEEFIAENLMGAQGTVAEYVRQVGRVVHSLARHGSAVVIGRGSQFILPANTALRVRVVCPLEQRIDGYASRHGVARRDAEKSVRQGDKERKAFYVRHFQTAPEESAAYDITVNTGALSVDAAASIVTAAYSAKFRLSQSSAH